MLTKSILFSNSIISLLSDFFLLFLYFSRDKNSEFKCKTDGYDVLKAEIVDPNLEKIGSNLQKDTTYKETKGSKFLISDSVIIKIEENKM